MTLHANMKAENVVVMSGVDIYHHQHQIPSENEGNFLQHYCYNSNRQEFSTSRWS